MTDSTSTTLEQKKDRRGLLALIGAGGAAAAAALLGRSNKAEAGHTDTDSSADISASIHIGVINDRDDPERRAGTGATILRGTTAGVIFKALNASPGDFGAGVAGSHSGGGTGVAGTSISGEGTGVSGYGKTGVHALSSKPFRLALRTEGRVRMNCARKVTLSSANNLVTLPSGVTAGAPAVVMAMVQGNPGNGAFIKRAFRVDSTHIRIQFNKAPGNPTAVGYWVVHTG